jgi:hypothetical protein
MPFEETRLLFDEVKKLTEQEQGPFVTWLIVSMIRDVAYYIVAGLVAWALGRRLIQATVTAMREARRERA